MSDSFDACRVAYEQGQRDALAEAVQRVEALPEYALRDTCVAAIAAIKGDQP